MDRRLHLTQSPAGPWRFIPPPGEGACSLLLIILGDSPDILPTLKAAVAREIGAGCAASL